MLKIPFTLTLGAAAAAVLTVAPLGAQEYRQAPQLAKMAEEGTLPPVAERLPDDPMVVAMDEIGDYGGDWRTAIVGGLDNSWLIRTIGYEHLVRWTPDWTGIIPNVAANVTASDDATEFTFDLRPGMKWSDGEPFGVDDIMFWYNDVLMNPDLTPSVPASFTAAGEPVTVTKVDEDTVSFKFAGPNGLFLRFLASVHGCGPTSYPKHYFETFHPTYNENLDSLVKDEGVSGWVDLFERKGGVQSCISSNPAFWQATEIPTLHPWAMATPYGDSSGQVVAERNPFYWKVDEEGRQLPYIDRVVYAALEDKQTLLLQVLNGDIDMMSRGFNTTDNRRVVVENEERGNYHLATKIAESGNVMALALNLTHKDPVKREIFNNKDFRIGLSHAINRQEISDIVYASQLKPRQLAPLPDSPFYDEEMAQQYAAYDVDKANEYLDKAGYGDRDGNGVRLGPDGKPISFVVEVADVFNNWPDTLELIKGYFQKVGIDMELRVIDRSLLVNRKTSNDHDAAVWGMVGGFDVFLSPVWYLPIDGVESAYGIPWAQYWNNPDQGQEPPEHVKKQFDLYRQIAATGDEAKQSELMKEILAIAKEQFYAIGIASNPDSYTVVKNNFHNVPDVYFDGWTYPDPAPLNPAAFWIGE
ncbi:ABC transporter substrate-binding protein [Oceaniglobus trochenteri]|uniref:ABC transporter substrate-binding protein n=1 Tax=Oceaniglobus trochenteri TaxID=2763260 RepID=UPI001CFF9888|nr:ABC transporter substrate-binding protein [Oceaniglobus trochenteri]